MREVELKSCIVNNKNHREVLNPKIEIENLIREFTKEPTRFFETSDLEKEEAFKTTSEQSKVMEMLSGKYTGATSELVVSVGRNALIPFIVTVNNKVVAVAGKTAREVRFSTPSGVVDGVVTHNFIYKGVAFVKKNSRESTMETHRGNKGNYNKTLEKFTTGEYAEYVELLDDVQVEGFESSKYRAFIYKDNCTRKNVMKRNGNIGLMKSNKGAFERFMICQLRKAKSYESGRISIISAIGKVKNNKGDTVRFYCLENAGEGKFIEVDFKDINFKLLGNLSLMDYTIKSSNSVLTEKGSDGTLSFEITNVKEKLYEPEYRNCRHTSNCEIKPAKVTPTISRNVTYVIAKSQSGKIVKNTDEIVNRLKSTSKTVNVDGTLTIYNFLVNKSLLNYNLEYRVVYDADTKALCGDSYNANKPILTVSIDRGGKAIITIHAYRCEVDSEVRVNQVVIK